MIPHNFGDQSSPSENGRGVPNPNKLVVGVGPINDENAQHFRIQLAVKRYNSNGLPPFRSSPAYRCSMIPTKSPRPRNADEFAESSGPSEGNNRNILYARPRSRLPSPKLKPPDPGQSLINGYEYSPNSFYFRHRYPKVNPVAGESAAGAERKQPVTPEMKYTGPDHFPTCFIDKSYSRIPRRHNILSHMKSHTSGLPVSRVLDDSAEKYSDLKSTRSVLDVLQDLSRKRMHGKDETEDNGKRRCRGLGGDSIEGEIIYKPLFVPKSRSPLLPKKDQTTQTLLDAENGSATPPLPEDPKWELRKKLARQNNEISASLSSSLQGVAVAKRKRAAEATITNGIDKEVEAKKLKIVEEVKTAENLEPLLPLRFESPKPRKKPVKSPEKSPKSPSSQDRLMSIYHDIQNFSEVKLNAIKAMNANPGESQFVRPAGISEVDSSEKKATETTPKTMFQLPIMATTSPLVQSKTIPDSPVSLASLLPQKESTTPTNIPSKLYGMPAILTTAATPTQQSPSKVSTPTLKFSTGSPIGIVSPSTGTSTWNFGTTKTSPAVVGAAESLKTADNDGKQQPALGGFTFGQTKSQSPVISNFLNPSKDGKAAVSSGAATALPMFGFGASTPKSGSPEKSTSQTVPPFSFGLAQTENPGLGSSALSFVTQKTSGETLASTNAQTPLTTKFTFGQKSADTSTAPTFKFGSPTASDAKSANPGSVITQNSLPAENRDPPKWSFSTTITATDSEKNIGTMFGTTLPGTQPSAPSGVTEVAKGNTEGSSLATPSPFGIQSVNSNDGEATKAATSSVFARLGVPTSTNNKPFSFGKPEEPSSTTNQLGFGGFGAKTLAAASTTQAVTTTVSGSQFGIDNASLAKSLRAADAFTFNGNVTPSTTSLKIASTPFLFGQNIASPAASDVFGQPTATTTSSTSTPLTFTSKPAIAPPATTAPTMFGQSGTTAAATMFGQPSTNTVTSSVFGPPTATTTPASVFGSTASKTTPASVFGATASTTTAASVFGATAVSSAPVSLFGATSSATTTAPPLFGQVATSKTAAPMFGQPATTASVPAFGATNTAFGGTSSGFTQNETTKPFSFGQTAASTVASPSFGSTTTAAPAVFGATAITSAGNIGQMTATQPPAFGTNAITSTPAFGANTSTSTPAFGANTSTSTAAFGSAITTAPPAFGSAIATAPPAFGSGTNTAPPAFGSGTNTAPPAFGSGTTAAPPAFGSGTTTTASPAFGQGTSTFSFGTTPTPSAFGQTGAVVGFGQAAVTTASSSAPPPFPLSTPAFGNTAGQQPASGGFGQSQVAPSFGQNSAFQFGATTTAPATTTNAFTFGKSAPPNAQPFAFGSNPPPAFGAAAGAPPAFGSANPTPAPSPFGAAAPPTFGSPAPAPATSSSAPFAFGAGQGNKPVFNFGSAAPAAAQAPAAPFTFGSGSTTSGSAGFNFSANTGSASSGGFNFSGAPGFGQTSTPNTTFGTGSTPSPAFGAAPTAGGFPFGQTPSPGAFNMPGTFSMGSGSSQPRSRASIRTRRRP